MSSQFAASTYATALPIQSTNTGCAYQGLFKTSALFWLPGLVFEPVLFALVAYKAWLAKSQDSRGKIIEQIARDRFAHLLVLVLSVLSTDCASKSCLFCSVGTRWYTCR